MVKRDRTEDFNDAALHYAAKRRKRELLAWNWPSTFTLDELEFKEFAQRPDAYAKLWAMICSSIYGHVNVKKAIACLLFGGSKKRLPDRGATKRRYVCPTIGRLINCNVSMLQTAEQGTSLVDSTAPSLAIPKAISNAVDRHLVVSIAPGIRLTAIGIYSVFQASAAQEGAIYGRNHVRVATENFKKQVRAVVGYLHQYFLR
ncbi:hypothetical protein MA16_Dca008098 [Dendrobium catenatum]|uniref:MCM C-terminal AAA(+) ATPase domain-containing protein n=1 Tax=Dendrobium catenatum TaxID=906689 RepID=A0A2I0WCZ5_9ASPA|nr:hypothetical protein MA16_Dca008098 [Dendrobium catenatum]